MSRWRSYRHQALETSPKDDSVRRTMRDGLDDLPYSVWITAGFGYDAELFESGPDRPAQSQYRGESSFCLGVSRSACNGGRRPAAFAYNKCCRQFDVVSFGCRGSFAGPQHPERGRSHRG